MLPFARDTLGHMHFRMLFYCCARQERGTRKYVADVYLTILEGLSEKTPSLILIVDAWVLQ